MNHYSATINAAVTTQQDQQKHWAVISNATQGAGQMSTSIKRSQEFLTAKANRELEVRANAEIYIQRVWWGGGRLPKTMENEERRIKNIEIRTRKASGLNELLISTENKSQNFFQNNEISKNAPNKSTALSGGTYNMTSD